MNVLILQIVWEILKLIGVVLPLIFHKPTPPNVKAKETMVTAVKNAQSIAKVLKVAQKPETEITVTAVKNTVDAHKDEWDDINKTVDSEDFQRMKRGE